MGQVNANGVAGTVNSKIMTNKNTGHFQFDISIYCSILNCKQFGET